MIYSERSKDIDRGTVEGESGRSVLVTVCPTSRSDESSKHTSRIERTLWFVAWNVPFRYEGQAGSECDESIHTPGGSYLMRGLVSSTFATATQVIRLQTLTDEGGQTHLSS